MNMTKHFLSHPTHAQNRTRTVGEVLSLDTIRKFGREAPTADVRFVDPCVAPTHQTESEQ